MGVLQIAGSQPVILTDHSVTPDERRVMDDLLHKFRTHKMMLKNVVYRTDTSTLRITWADDPDHYVVKAAYKTGKDPVLGNSVYADKRKLISVKIMYRTNNNDYDYLQIENMDEISKPKDNRGEAAQSVTAVAPRNFVIEGQLTNEQCRFCHILAQNDGSPNGVFFPRYQESYKTTNIKNVGNLFHMDGFESLKADKSVDLGLAAMKDDFLYRKVPFQSTSEDPTIPHIVRSVIELPQLIEVMARDNGKSMCVSFQTPFPDGGAPTPNNYVCADNAAQMLYVRLTNPMISGDKKTNEYAEPYFSKY